MKIRRSTDERRIFLLKKQKNEKILKTLKTLKPNFIFIRLYGVSGKLQNKINDKKGEKIMYCKNCGSELDFGAKFCKNCGAKVDVEVAMEFQNVVNNATYNVKENEFAKPVKKDFERSESLNTIKDKAQKGFSNAIAKAKETSQNLKAMSSTEKKNYIAGNINVIAGIVRLVSIIASVLLTLSWFLPVVKMYGHSYTMLKVLDMAGESDATAGFIFTVVLCLISIIWSAIPKKWAAIVGTVYSLIPMVMCIGQIGSWVSNDIKLAFGAVIMIPLALAVFALSVVKLILSIMAKKQNALNNSAFQPQPFNNGAYQQQYFNNMNNYQNR